MWVDCLPFGGSVVQYYRNRVNGEEGVFNFIGIVGAVFNEVITRDLVGGFLASVPKGDLEDLLRFGVR